ncbi:hypothetical protein ACLOJK_005029 [Asimina triloba]
MVSALLEMDLEKNKKKIHAPQHFEFVALALEPVDLQVNVHSLVVASVERNQALDSMEARQIPGSHGAAGCYVPSKLLAVLPQLKGHLPHIPPKHSFQAVLSRLLAVLPQLK